MLITDFARTQAGKLRAETWGGIYPMSLEPAVRHLSAELWEVESLGHGAVGVPLTKLDLRVDEVQQI